MSASICRKTVSLLIFILLGPLSVSAQTIVYPNVASDLERLAAHEVRRYVYLRTGELLPLSQGTRLPAGGDVVAIGSHRSPLVSSVAADVGVPSAAGAFLIRSLRNNDRTVLLITGGDSGGTLYGAYRFAEHLGVGFGLAGDAVPDGTVPLDLRGYDELAVPRFETRGVLPYHDFFPGPDGWSREDYLSVISQLPKLGMNFIGLHTYMTRYGNQWMRDNDYRTGPEPTVWVGLPEDINPDGTVSWSYPATYAHTHRERSWAFSTWDAGEFAAGSADLFGADGAGAPLVGDDVPRTVAESNAVFNRVAAVLDEAFGLAGQLGVRTAVGTEVPLGLEPAGRDDIDPPEDWVRGMTRELRARIEARGDDPADPTAVREVYRGIFERIMRAHPLDYYWLWSYEIWSANPDGPGVTREQVRAIEADIRIAREVLEELGNPFEIAHAGWILGTTDNHGELENVYPPEVPFSSSWGDADGYDELSAERVKWPGIFVEQDWGLMQWQGGVYTAWEHATTAQDVDAEGSIGTIWRTTILDPNIAGLKNLHWAFGSSNSPPRTEIEGDMWVWMEEQYRDWARRQMGPEVADRIAAILAEYDGQVPTPTGWTEWGPGEVLPDSRPWGRVRREYAFVDEFEALRRDVVGASNLERFDYWLSTLQLLREMAEYGTVRHDFERAMARNRYQRAVTAMTELARLHERITTLQLERARNASDIGEIIQFQLVNWKGTILDRFEDELERGLGRPIPPEAYPTAEYLGDPRVFVAPARTSVREGESLSITATVLGTDAAPRVYLRAMGESGFREVPMRRVAEAVYTVEVTAQAGDFEYHVAVEAAGEELRWPVTAPERNHTVIVGP